MLDIFLRPELFRINTNNITLTDRFLKDEMSTLFNKKHNKNSIIGDDNLAKKESEHQ